jgi:hypothetical protein
LKAEILPFGKAVSVFWVDSACAYGWKGHKDVGDTLGIVSLGYVAKCDEDRITLTTSITNQLDVNSPISIPWVAIFQIRELPDAFDRSINGH